MNLTYILPTGGAVFLDPSHRYQFHYPVTNYATQDQWRKHLSFCAIHDRHEGTGITINAVMDTDWDSFHGMGRAIQQKDNFINSEGKPIYALSQTMWDTKTNTTIDTVMYCEHKRWKDVAGGINARTDEFFYALFGPQPQTVVDRVKRYQEQTSMHVSTDFPPITILMQSTLHHMRLLELTEGLFAMNPFDVVKRK